MAMKTDDVMRLSGLLSILAYDKSQSYISKKEALRLRRVLNRQFPKRI